VFVGQGWLVPATSLVLCRDLAVSAPHSLRIVEIRQPTSRAASVLAGRTWPAQSPRTSN